MRVIAYTRVSTQKQVEEGLGLDSQRAAIKAWAKTNKHKIVGWHSDEMSGTVPVSERPGLTAALVEVKSTADALVVDRLDRLARDLVAQEHVVASLKGADKELHSVDPGEDQNLRLEGDDRGTRTMIRQILGAVSQQARTEIVYKLKVGRAAKAAQGGYATGSPPYGWKASGRELVPHEAEQLVLTRIHGLHDQKHSLRAIAAVLNDEKIPTKRGTDGKGWQANTVRVALTQRVALADRA